MRQFNRIGNLWIPEPTSQDLLNAINEIKEAIAEKSKYQKKVISYGLKLLRSIK